MSRVTVITVVEGQTENGFLGSLLAGHLGAIGIDLHIPIVTIGKHRGGTKFLSCNELSGQLKKFLKDRRNPYVTTFFDYYAFPEGTRNGWEFVRQAKERFGFHRPHDVAAAIESELHRLTISGLDVANVEERFIPYLQLHELEALYFAEPQKMADLFEDSTLASTFSEAVEQCGCCELINDSPETAPSKRIESAFPGYKKGRSTTAHGPRLAAKLNLETVRRHCPRFSEWLSKLESLAPH